MTDAAGRWYRWIFLLTAGSLYAGTVLRSVLMFRGDPLLGRVLLLLLAWLVLFGLETVVTPRWRSFFPLYMALQAAIVVYLLSRSTPLESDDYFAWLFGVLGMQAVQRVGWKAALLWVCLFVPLTALPLATATDHLAQTVAQTLTYAGVNVFLAYFALVARRAEEAHARNQDLLDELQAANDETELYARSVERLAAAEERHRLARDLHDSVTQTVFSMNLTAQSAALLLDRDRRAAALQLERLEGLAEGALAEIGALGSELAPAPLGGDELVVALQRHLAERRLPEGLSVDLAVEGAEGSSALRPQGGELSVKEESCLFRIVQEALNNVVKHSQAREATIRVRLSHPRRLEIQDTGRGFDPALRDGAGGMGLDGMSERAVEIGWVLRVESAPGAGTLIVVEEGADRPERSEGG